MPPMNFTAIERQPRRREPSSPTDPIDTAAIRRARARLAEEPEGEGWPSGRDDLNAAARGSAEHAILRGIYETLDKRSDDRHRARVFDAAVAIEEARVAHERARPERWAALTDAQRLAFAVASYDEVPSAIQRLLTRIVVPLLGKDLAKIRPPSAFEQEHWDADAADRARAAFDAAVEQATSR